MLKKIGMPLIGALIAIISVILVAFGNPGNMGFCIACFLRDSAGAVGLQTTATVQYLRPEIIGIIFGGLIAAIATKQFSPRGGSAPVTRFFLGFSVMIGALIFLGCPLRMLLRIAGGDLNAVVGLAGFVAGIFGGVFFLNRGYSLKRSYTVAKTDGFIFPTIALVLFGLMLLVPSVLSFSTEGPGSMHAPIAISLTAGLVMGVIGFVSRLCFVGGIRDSVLLKNFWMLAGLLCIVVVGVIANLIMGKFGLSFTEQPIAHTDGLWNFLGMLLVGFASSLLGGCPFKQLVLAGSGNADSVVTVFGMIVGAAFAHNFGMASSANGVTDNGKIGFVIVFLIVLFIACYNTFSRKKDEAVTELDDSNVPSADNSKVPTAIS